MKRKSENILLILLLAIIILAPHFYNLFDIKTRFVTNENRVLSQFPKLNVKNIKNFPKDFTKYYNDNFGFRQELIFVNQKISDDIFNVDRTSSKVLVGKNNWLYSREKNALKDYQGTLKFNQKTLNKITDLFLTELKEAKKNNIVYLIVIAPDKHNIYPEFLPEYVKQNKTQGDRLLPQFIQKIKSIEPDFPILDLTSSLLEAKKDSTIYMQTDTHWNDLGAYVGYREIIKYLSKYFHGLKPIQIKNFKSKQKQTDHGNLAQMINTPIIFTNYYLKPRNKHPFKLVNRKKTKEHFSSEWNIGVSREKGSNSLFEYINANKKLPNLLMFRDSFTDNLLKMLPYNFNRSIFIWTYPCKINFTLTRNQGINVVIREISEINLSQQLLLCE